MGLFSDCKAKANPMKLPTFSSNPGEAFIDFAHQFNKAAISNKIPNNDQLDTLLEIISTCLPADHDQAQPTIG